MGAAARPQRVSFERDDGTIDEVDLDLAAATAGLREGQVRYVPLSMDPSDPVPVALATASDGTIWVHAAGITSQLRPLARRQAMQRRLARAERAAGATDPQLRSPMPGTVVAVHVADGGHVAAGERVVTIEAMKMEHPVLAPHDGTATVTVAVGDQVGRDQLIARVDPDPTAD